MYILEGCADNLKSAVNAYKGGADRIELCANLVIGGTTPSPALLKQVKENISIPVRPLIRVRFGDFLYSDEEIKEMADTICALKEAGADGFVIGALTKDGRLCKEQIEILIQAAGGLPLTLHRAFDMAEDPFKALEDAVSMGFDTILTSARKDAAIDGIELYNELYAAACGRIQIMAGAGINPDSIRTLKNETKLTAFHMSGKVTLQSEMEYKNPDVHMGLKGISEYEKWVSSEENFKKARAVLDGNE